LVNYWPIEDSTTDIVSGKNMTLVLNAALTADRFGNLNSAVKFSSGYATLPDGVYFESSTKGYTIMFWFYLLELNDKQILFNFGNYTTDNIQFILLSQNLYLQILNSFVEFYYISSPLCKVNQKQWTHLTITFNSGMLNIYVNGVVCLSKISFMFSSNIMRFNNYVGKSINNDGGLLNGVIDELKIFDRPLSVDEIAYEKNRQPPIKLSIKFEFSFIFSTPI
jgi:hypothetical protein